MQNAIHSRVVIELEFTQIDFKVFETSVIKGGSSKMAKKPENPLIFLFSEEYSICQRVMNPLKREGTQTRLVCGSQKECVQLGARDSSYSVVFFPSWNHWI